MNWAAAAVMLGMTTSVSMADEPAVLSDFDLDAITAAAVSVDVGSIAVTRGDRTRLLTAADTLAVAGEGFDLGVGLTFGHGFACCGDEAEVGVASAAVGVGDIVHSGTRTLKHDDGVVAQGLSAAYVVALSPHEPLLRLRDLRPASADVATQLRGSATE